MGLYFIITILNIHQNLESNMNIENKFKIKMLKKLEPIFLLFAQVIVEESFS